MDRDRLTKRKPRKRDAIKDTKWPQASTIQGRVIALGRAERARPLLVAALKKNRANKLSGQNHLRPSAEKGESVRR